MSTLRFFKPEEFACKCGCGRGYDDMDAGLLRMLDEARALAGIPFSLSSAFRCAKHNKAVGGVADSAHTHGYAVGSCGQRSGQAAGRHLLRCREGILMDFSMISDFLNSQTGSWALFLSAASAVCAWAATLMPAPSETSGVIYRSLYKVINWIGANIGKARNADDAQKQRKLQ